MPNTLTTVSRVGFGSRIMGAIIGVPIGIVLVIGSCIFLYWNEGRVDYSKIASKSIAVNASSVDQSDNGKFVSVTGNISTNQQISDGAYLKPGSYIALRRTVEEFAWVQQQQNQSNNNTGGNSTSTTTYTYSEEWTSTPQNSSTFQDPQGHENPQLPIAGTEVEASNGTVGAYSFDPQSIKLPAFQNVNLSQSNTNLTSASPAVAAATASSQTVMPLNQLSLASSQYIFGGIGSLAAPQLGDIRISYQALSSGSNGTVFGKLNNGMLTTYTDSNDHTLYDLLLGNRQTAIATLHSQYEKTIWIFRAIGVGVIWLGLMMLFGPLDVLLDFIPVVGRIGGFIVFVITFPVALVLGGTVIIIGYTLHHTVALIIGVPLVLIIWIAIFKLIKKARNIPKRGNGGEPPIMPTQPTNPYIQPPTSPMPPPPPPPAAPPTSGSLFPTNPA